MQLIAEYQDGSKRIINLSAEFFTDSEIKVGYKVSILTPVDKALSIVSSNGVNPYTISLMRNNEIVFENKNEANKPFVLEPVELIQPNITEKQIKKLKKQSFSMFWNPRLTPNLSFERGINLFFKMKNHGNS